MQVKLIDVMGDDARVANAARVSFDKETYPDEDGNILERDQKLIAYLARHNHWTPFSHVQITMREEVPIFVARQRFKHMVGFTYNEVSRRYVDSPPQFFTPDVWRGRAENKKQGSSDEEISFLKVDSEYSPSVGYVYQEAVEACMYAYQLMLDGGVAPEQARMILPQSMMTSYYVTGSLAAWARAYKLRIDPHAQKEIQDLAHMWGEVMEELPQLKYSWEALTNT